MPDISMCADEDCQMRESCYRFLAMPSQFKAYGAFRRSEGMPKCEYYRPVSGHDKFSRLDDKWQDLRTSTSSSTVSRRWRASCFQAWLEQELIPTVVHSIHAA